VSNFLFNKHTGLFLACPITDTNRNIPFHLPVPSLSKLSGFVMVEQVKSVDFSSKKAKFISKAPQGFWTTRLKF
jgi:mRNA interferase MazF